MSVYKRLRDAIENGPRWRRRWCHRFGNKALGQAFDREWGDLSRYNGERARGIAHTPGYDAFMAVKQAQYNHLFENGVYVVKEGSWER